VKPTAMLQDALIDLTNRGEIVLDPFLGSGSTLIAAENTGRLCCGIELDPLRRCHYPTLSGGNRGCRYSRRHRRDLRTDRDPQAVTMRATNATDMWRMLVEACRGLPNSRHDNQVDSISQALAHVTPQVPAAASR
jgi:hypothetical protein